MLGYAFPLDRIQRSIMGTGFLEAFETGAFRRGVSILILQRKLIT